jgi:two-component system phosphate regulon sensor histidine kinase PhoR
VEKNTSIRKILIILLSILLLPALFFSATEISTLGEYEEMITRVYEQQLETILFSVNQYAWDFVNTWIAKIQNSLSLGDKTVTRELIQGLLETNTAIAYVAISDTMMMSTEFFYRDTIAGFEPGTFKELKGKEAVIGKILKLSRQGYRKVETSMEEESADSTLTLFYIQPIGGNLKLLVAIVIQPTIFIADVLGPKLKDVAGSQFLISVFSKKNNRILYSNTTKNVSEFKQTKKLWLFPDYILGISLSGKSIEDLARDRFFNSMILIGILYLLIIVGGFFLIKNIRREMQLARLKSDFVSNVSHELRTPLALIRMYAETLEMDRVKTDEKRYEYYRIINQESERLTRLINNILNFSRIESGRKEYKFSAVDINQVTQNVFDTYSYHIEQEGFQLKIELDSQISPVQADSEAVSEALINLIDNAIKYSRDNKEITVRTGELDDSVFLEVQDQGIGIDQVHQNAIFEKFYRISSALVHDTKGSGLGLSLVQHIMNSHEGKIWLKSEPGKGSTFRLIFPINKSDSE